MGIDFVDGVYIKDGADADVDINVNMYLKNDERN